MRTMRSHIILGDYELDRVSRVNIDASWQTLGDTASIEVPNIDGLDQKVKAGDEVVISLGYDDLLVEEFRGKVARLSASYPIRIECEDAMWDLKQTSITKTWKSTTLGDVLSELVPDALLRDVPSIELKPFRLDRITKYEALQVIKDQFGLAIYFVGPQLYAGLPYGIEGEPNVNLYHMQKNVASGNNLEYRRADDVRVKVEAISVRPDNSRLTFEAGDADGEQHTLHFFDLSMDELKQQAEEKLKLLKFDGYKGSFLAFGFPNTAHSSIVDLQDAKYPTRAGQYYVDRVVVMYGPSGYRREVHLGRRAGNSEQQP
ncbi:MAG TPA: hypothetical protein PKE21_13860 [Flavobacteriales bacterium]|nr:hypothetical protein [Flavobacteriales bacterium]HMR28563.1 hypothetical protein [Flavobacteriales bacterium]